MTDILRRAADLANRHFDEIRDLPVTGPAREADLRQHLESVYAFDRPVPADDVIDDVAAMLTRGQVQVTHPAYFGLFNPSVYPIGIAAATLTAAFNPQTAAASHSPAAHAMEQHALRFLATAIGYAPGATAAHFCSGGQEANTTAVVVALTRAFPAVRERGVRALAGDPRIYVSAEGHHSFEKAAHVTGLGRAAVRRVAVDAALRLDVAALVHAIEEDRAAGRLPFLVVGTAGATSSGVVDPLGAVADVCAKAGVWFHADAAWGGGALLSPALRVHLAGIERADSVTWDAHKWLQAPLGSGMFFTRHPDAPAAAFATASAYMPAARDDAADPSNVSHQWSRRAPGIAVFAQLAELGADGCAAMVDRMADLGDALRAKLSAAEFTVLNSTPLPVVAFSHPRLLSGEATTADVARLVQLGGRSWVSPTVLADGRKVLRACVTSHRTTESDLDTLVEDLVAAVGHA